MLERKGLGIRLGAAIIDALVAGIIAGIFVAVLGTIGTVLAGLIYIAYPVIEILKAQSPGKMALKLKVTSEDGTPATQDQLIRRGITRWGPMVLSGVLLLAGIAVPFLATLANAAVGILGIVLLAISWSSLQATRQGFWDLQGKTAVMGPVAGPVQGFPVIPPAQAGPIPPATPPQV